MKAPRRSGVFVVMFLFVLAVVGIGGQWLSAQSYPMVTIMEIQGDGLYSPYAGQTVTTMGVVTAISSNGRDMWIQDLSG